MSERDLYAVKPARAWGRFWASLIDSLLVGIPAVSVPLLVYALLGLKPTLAQLGTNLWANMWFVFVGFVYHWYYLHTAGATPGKAAYGFEVISLYPRTKVTDRGAAIREGAKILMNRIPLINRVISLVNVFLILFTKEKQTLYDHLARTQVVKVHKPWSIKQQVVVFTLLVVGYVMIGLVGVLFFDL